ncbi:hypothetical protein PIB30_083212 [Stylosanthes scabra]|uniref:Uncharacterized protein n=1 Tax=Stylosanthes scabra TaxID=79078 RepID=A0ABU6RS18_9FABA|nr:hypothetical protein [Stylosanthes scabra]
MAIMRQHYEQKWDAFQQRFNETQAENRKSFGEINTRMNQMDDQLSYLCYTHQIANESMFFPYQNTMRQFMEMEHHQIPINLANLNAHRAKEEEMHQERMRYEKVLKEVAAQRAKELNKGKVREEENEIDDEETEDEGNRRDKPTIEYDCGIEKTLKKNRSRVKAQRALQFQEQTANSDEGASEKFSEEEIVEENSEKEIQDNMAENANNQLMLRNPFGNPEDHRQVHRIVSSNNK